MNITVNMTAEEFLEFVAWGKDRDYYKSRLDKELNKRFSIHAPREGRDADRIAAATP